MGGCSEGDNLVTITKFLEKKALEKEEQWGKRMRTITATLSHKMGPQTKNPKHIKKKHALHTNTKHAHTNAIM